MSTNAVYQHFEGTGFEFIGLTRELGFDTANKYFVFNSDFYATPEYVYTKESPNPWFDGTLKAEGFIFQNHIGGDAATFDWGGGTLTLTGPTSFYIDSILEVLHDLNVRFGGTLAVWGGEGDHIFDVSEAGGVNFYQLAGNGTVNVGVDNAGKVVILPASMLFTGEGVPNVSAVYNPSNATFDDSVGNNGDTFIDGLTKDIYIKVSGSWS